jgi:hypothetical protein
MTTLIELIRKVELYKGAYFDLRTLSVALLHWCKIMNTLIRYGQAQTSNRDQNSQSLLSIAQIYRSVINLIIILIIIIIIIGACGSVVG